MAYSMTARAYLKRAEWCLQQDDTRYLFYAAFELRCAVEERMREYLGDWDHVSKKDKRHWEVDKLGAATDRAFKTDRIMRWEVRDEHDKETLSVLYYTPVTKKLQANAKRLGDYLHAQREARPEGDQWWLEFRRLLDEMVQQLRVATTGTLKGPALKDGNKMLMQTAITPELTPSHLLEFGRVLRVKVDYLDELPSIFEEKAVVWKD